MDAAQHYRQRQSHDTEDLALSFLEEEVGRHDWRGNWQTLRRQGTAESKVQAWLTALNIEHPVGDITSYLDNMARERNGRWL